MASQSPMVESTAESQKYEFRKLQYLSFRSSEAQTTRFAVSRYPDKDSSVVYQFHDEPSYLRYFSLEVSHE